MRARVKNNDETVNEPQREDLAALQPVIERVVAARVRDPDVVEDVVQETLLRVMSSRDRLADHAVASYAVVTARNVVNSLGRMEQRRRRHAHRLIDVRDPRDPEKEALRREDEEAIGAALARLSDEDREALIAHEVNGIGTGALAEALGTTRGAVATRLARVRAKVRVDYVLALRQVDLPTDRCRPVLLSLSSADQRRQHQLDAGGHLLQCSTCAELSGLLIERRRSLASFWPLALLATLLRRLWQARRNPGTQVAAGAVVATVLALVFLVARLDRSPPPAELRARATAAGTGTTGPAAGTTPTTPPGNPPTPAQAAPTLIADGSPVLPLSSGPRLDRFSGQVVEGRGVLVYSVPSPAGFWVGDNERDRVWVDVIGGDPPAEIRQGMKLFFIGTMEPNHPEFAQRIILEGGDAALLEQQGHHIDVPVESIRFA